MKAMSSVRDRRTPCRTADDVQTRLVAGARTVVLDSSPDVIVELYDLPDGVTLRIEGASRVQITDAAERSEEHGRSSWLPAALTPSCSGTLAPTPTPPPPSAASTAPTTMPSFPAMDHAQVAAGENATVHAYDHAAVHADGGAQVHATDDTRIVLRDNARAVAARGVAIFGPARANTSVAAG